LRVSGIIVEYNPFHNGHNYHLKKTKDITGSQYIIAIMSGNFLQRGEPALFNKWIRTKMALYAGVDIVIELPVVYSCQSAEFFAYGAIQLLDQLGVVNNIVFGCEEYDINKLKSVSDILAEEPIPYKNFLKRELKKGKSFPSARAEALEKYFLNNVNNSISNDIKTIIQSPNNILGIEYLKWLKIFNSSIIPKIITRKGPGYHSKVIDKNYSSATAIRNQIFSNNENINNLKGFLPDSSYLIIKEALKENYIPAHFEYLSKSIFSILLRDDSISLKEYLDISEGLDRRLLNYLATNSIEEFINLVKTKRYTYTRIQRILSHILLDIKVDDLNMFKENGGVQYIRILGFSEKGKNILSELKKKSQLPIITNLSKSYKLLNPVQRKMINYDIRATNIHTLHFSKNYKKNLDFSSSPIIV